MKFTPFTTTLFALLFCLMGQQTIVHQASAGNTFYVDPINGSMAGDGSAANPWSTLQNVLSNNLIESQKPAVNPYNGTLAPNNPGAPIKAGDTIKLLDGYHGNFLPRGYFNTDTITIEAETGHTPTLERINFKGGENWKLKGLTVSPELGTSTGGNIVHFETHNWWGPASNMSIDDSTIYSTLDSSAWTAGDWLANAGNGIKATGTDFSFANNQITNVAFGITTSGDDIVASRNSIENYSKDGIRGGGDRVTFEYNTIKTSFEVDDNHDDAIQFFQGFGVASHDVILRGNDIESFADPARPLTHGAQGIGNFDGPYINWLVENNVVKTSHFHGISVYDSEDSVIINNTVLDPTGAFDPWINVNGSTNATVRNNLSTNYITTGATGLISDHNITLSTTLKNNIFVDWQNGDVRLKAGGVAIDAGESLLAPSIDIGGTPRPIGASVDIGAYELSLAGDYNFDGIVDAADYSVWRDSLGSTTQLAADGDGNGTVDQADYLYWRDRFGDTLSSSANGNAVPEPSSGGLLFLALVTSRISNRKKIITTIYIATEYQGSWRTIR